MKKITSLLLPILLGVAISCKKEAEVAPPTVCQVQQITYRADTREAYQYDANGFINRVQYDYTDQTGQPAFYGATCTYNSQGLLERATKFANTPLQNTYEQFTYTNGSLSKIEATELGKLVYRFDVTTNANKQITGMKGVSFDKANYPEYTSTFTYDAQGRCVKAEATDANGVFYRSEVSEFDPAVKTDYDSFKGWPVVVISYWYDYGTFMPVNGFGARRRYTISYGYDDNRQFVGLRKMSDLAYTYKINSNGYLIESTVSDASVTPATPLNTIAYTYLNCK